MIVWKVVGLLYSVSLTSVVAFVGNNNNCRPCHTPFVTTTKTTSLQETGSSSNVVDKEEEVSVNPRLEGLAILLDEGTRKSHSMAENSAFVSGFFKGLASRESYGDLVTSLYFVYTAMEGAMDASLDDGVKTMDDDALRRVASLEQDLIFLYGANEWKSKVQISPATQVYVNRIEEIAQTKPYLLLAHLYTRYLGDLFGGQMMGNMASRSLDLQGNDGVAFYNFQDISSVNNYITGWYQRLNDLDLTSDQKQEIVDEANFVFSLNIGILQELEGSPLKALWTLAINTLKQNLNLV